MQDIQLDQLGTDKTRRDALKTLLGVTSAGLAAAAVGSKSLFAQAGVSPQAVASLLSATISAKHGHQVDLDAAELLFTLRELKKDGGQVTVDIQGSSGHGHSIKFDFYQGLQLILEGSLVVKSSFGSGHNHEVELRI
jgi:hypothetical protein